MSLLAAGTPQDPAIRSKLQVVMLQDDAVVAEGRRGKTASLVARQVCQQIVEGDLAEGDPLPSEADLMRRYGVSRAVLREALRLLEWDSYISVRRGPSGGATVTLPDVRVPARYCGLLMQVQGATLDDLDQALKVVEPEIVRLIARSKDRDTKVLERALEEEDPHPDRSAFVSAGRHFHEELPAAVSNITLKVMLRIVRRPEYRVQDESAIACEIGRWISPTLRVRFEYVTEIEREANGKFRAVLSRLPADRNRESSLQHC